MEFSVLSVVMFSAGTVLLYSAIKDQNPKDVMLWALGQKKKEEIGQISNQEKGFLKPIIPQSNAGGTSSIVPLPNAPNGGTGGNTMDWEAVTRYLNRN